MFDFGVNAGVERSLQAWRQSGGDINKFNQIRLQHYRSLPDYAKYGKAWEARVAETSGADLATGGTIAGIGMATSNMERNAGTINESYVSAAADRRKPGEIIAELAKDPRLEGLGAGYIDQRTNEIIAAAAAQGRTINKAVAGEMLRESVYSSAWTRNMPWFLGGGDDKGYRIDNDKLDELIKSYSNGDVERGVAANDRASRAAAATAQAMATAQAAAARYQAAVRANQTEGKRINLEPLYRDMILARQAAGQAQSGVINDPSLTSYATPKNAPAAEQPPTPRKVVNTRPAAPPKTPASDAFARKADGSFKDQTTAGSRARAGQAVGKVAEAPVEVLKWIGRNNPAAWVMRAIEP